MKIVKKVIVVVSIYFIAGCTSFRPQEPREEVTPLSALDNTRISTFVEVVTQGQAPVRGFGIVAGLPGTGSSECPQELRVLLNKQILQNVPEKGAVDPTAFLNSRDTAVVVVYGTIPDIPLKGETFDLRVAAHPATQTTSLVGGSLYSMEMMEFGRLSRNLFQYEGLYTHPLATASGPIFTNLIDSDSDPSRGYILGGGKITEIIPVRLRLLKPDYVITAAIRDRINERFGRDTAYASSAEEIKLFIPPRYQFRKTRFIDIVVSLDIRTSDEIRSERIESLIEQIISGEEKYIAELGLCGIGKPALKKLSALLKHPDEEVRFHAARCMLEIGDSDSLNVLKSIIEDAKSPFKVPAVRAIGENADRSQASPILSRALSQRDFEVRFEAYSQLKRLNDVSIQTKLIANTFLIDNVICGGPKVVYVSRSEVPKVVLFGGQVYCRDNIFVSSQDNSVTLNSVPGQGFISVMRKHPRIPKLIGPLRSGYLLSEVIKTLCEDPIVDEKDIMRKPGLGISYSEMVPVLARLVESGGTDADIRLGAMTDAGTLVEKLTGNDR